MFSPNQIGHAYTASGRLRRCLQPGVRINPALAVPTSPACARCTCMKLIFGKMPAAIQGGPRRCRRSKATATFFSRAVVPAGARRSLDRRPGKIDGPSGLGLHFCPDKASAATMRARTVELLQSGPALFLIPTSHKGHRQESRPCQGAQAIR